MFAIYGENHGVMRLEEDSFTTEAKAIEWLKANKRGMEALANWEIRQMYLRSTQGPVSTTGQLM